MLRMLIVPALIIGGCTRSFKTPADTLVVGLSAKPATLDPRYATDADGMRISGLIFESLVHPGPGFKPAGEAAESWKHGQRRYTFFLRPNLQFHNGRRATPEDIVFSFDHYRGPKSPFASSLKLIDQVNCHEEGNRLVVEIELSQESDRFLISDLPSIKILPKKEILSSEDTFARQLIGTGPYRFVRNSLNEIRLQSFFAETPFLKFKVIRDDYTRYQKLLKGEIDIVQNDIPAAKVAEFEKKPNQFRVLRYPGLNMAYLLVNFKDATLQDLPVRQALAQSLNREEIISFKLNGQARPATSLLTPENPYQNANLSNLKFDPEAARKIVAGLGSSGKRLILKTSNAPQTIDNGKVLAHQMSQSGLNLELESYEWATFYEDVKKGAFQLALMKWVGNVDPDIYRSAFHSSEFPPGRNRGFYKNERLDQLLDQGSKEASMDKRRAVFQQVQRIIHEDLAVLPLWYDEQVVILGQGVLNYKPSLTSDFLPLAKTHKREL